MPHPFHPLPLSARFVSVLLLILSLLAAGPAAADDLSIRVANEFGGYYRPGAWYPVIVSIENKPGDGRVGDRSLDFAGQLIVKSSAARSRHNAYEFIRDVEVPAFSTQRFILYARFPEELGGSRPMLEVRARSGRLLSVHPIEIQPLGKKQVLVVTVSEEMRRIVLPQARSVDINPVARATMPQRNLPEFWAAYDPADVLVFPNWPEAGLTGRRAQALEDWVTMGGTLVFLGGAQSNTYSAATDSDLFPVYVSSSDQFRWTGDRIERVPEGADLAAAQGFLVSKASLKPGSEVLFEAGDSVPLIVRRRQGRGQILFAAVDFEAMPAEFRQAILPYWQAVMPVPNMVGAQYGLHQMRDRIKTVKSSTARPPNPVLIILLCIIYTAAVGPLNFYLLGRRNLVHWAWLTVPIIVFFFSSLIYTIGSWTKGGESIAREVAILHGFEGQRDFEQRSYVSLFTRRSGDFRGEPQAPRQTVADSDRWYKIEGLFEGFFLDLSTGTALGFASANPVMRSETESVSVQHWPLRTFDSTIMEQRGPLRLAGAVQSTLRYRADARDSTFWFEGELRNETGLDFYHTMLVIGDRGLPLEPMPSGYSLRLTQQETVRPFYLAQSSRSQTRWKTVRASTFDFINAEDTESETDSAFNQENAGVVLGGLFEPQFLTNLIAPLKGRLYFVGLAESPDITVATDLDRDFGTRSLVVMVQLNPVPPPGPFVVPPQLVQIELQDYDSDPARLTIPERGTEPRIEMRQGKGVLTFRLPFESPDIEPTVVVSHIVRRETQTDQVFTPAIYDNNSATLFRLTPAMPLPNTVRGGLATPVTGRGWVVLNSVRPEDAPRGAMGSSAATELTRVEMEIQGVRRP
ncbi:MAG: hypothetical protein KF858_10975 [Candidatus Sumerlaeia bacterium]|nr:hypothetical protein [Candidatus Sumerlaeia bacterium]